MLAFVGALWLCTVYGHRAQQATPREWWQSSPHATSQEGVRPVLQQIEKPTAAGSFAMLCLALNSATAWQVLGRHSRPFRPQAATLHQPHMQLDEVTGSNMPLPSVAEDLPLLQVAASAALAAGQHLKARVGKAEILATKLDSADLVTAVDKECQDIIKSHVFALETGAHMMLGEEDVAPGVDAAIAKLKEQLAEVAARPSRGDADGEWLWIVDPIDGTTNFVQGLPLCAVSIGIVEARKGERMGAVILDPFREELFVAWRGRGAFLNGKPVSCGDVSTLKDAVVCGCSPKLHAVELALRGLAAIMPQVRSIRILGSGVLNFAWVACGRLSAYWEPELAPWDTAAGTLLIEEAGGEVSNLDGSVYKLESRAVLGSASGIHKALLQSLHDAEAV